MNNPNRFFLFLKEDSISSTISLKHMCSPIFIYSFKNEIVLIEYLKEYLLDIDDNECYAVTFAIGEKIEKSLLNFVLNNKKIEISQ